MVGYTTNAQTSGDEKSMMGNGGMMDMDQMTGSMHDCMEMHKNGKMCESQTMEQCQKNMSKSECKKMMKNMKQKEMKSKGS